MLQLRPRRSLAEVQELDIGTIMWKLCEGFALGCRDADVALVAGLNIYTYCARSGSSRWVYCSGAGTLNKYSGNLPV